MHICNCIKTAAWFQGPRAKNWRGGGCVAALLRVLASKEVAGTRKNMRLRVPSELVEEVRGRPRENGRLKWPVKGSGDLGESNIELGAAWPQPKAARL